MRKLILTHGLIAGGIVILSIIFTMYLAGDDPQIAGLEWLGYLTMLVALSIIFFGIKRYRDHELGGVIGFGTAFRLGMGVTLVASLVYVVAWEINLVLTDYAFIHDYTNAVIEDQKEAGLSGEELQQFIEGMELAKERYNNPFFRLPITFMEIFPVGVLITLLSSALLRKGGFLAAAP